MLTYVPIRNVKHLMGHLLFDYLLNNHDKILYGVASIALLVELTLIGLSGPLLFFAIAITVMQAIMSESPPSEIVLRTVPSKSSRAFATHMTRASR